MTTKFRIIHSFDAVHISFIGKSHIESQPAFLDLLLAQQANAAVHKLLHHKGVGSFVVDHEMQVVDVPGFISGQCYPP